MLSELSKTVFGSQKKSDRARCRAKPPESPTNDPKATFCRKRSEAPPPAAPPRARPHRCLRKYFQPSANSKITGRIKRGHKMHKINTLYSPASFCLGSDGKPKDFLHQSTIHRQHPSTQPKGLDFLVVFPRISSVGFSARADG